MAKQKTYKVTQKEKNSNFVGTISLRAIEKRIRKAHPPTTQIHPSKKSYTRRPKKQSEQDSED